MRYVHRMVDPYLAAQSAAVPTRLPTRSTRCGPEEEQHLRPAAPIDRAGESRQARARDKPTIRSGMRYDPRMAQGRAHSLATARAKKGTR